LYSLFQHRLLLLVLEAIVSGVLPDISGDDFPAFVDVVHSLGLYRDLPARRRTEKTKTEEKSIAEAESNADKENHPNEEEEEEDAYQMLQVENGELVKIVADPTLKSGTGAGTLNEEVISCPLCGKGRDEHRSQTG
jgi:hypothetical protein